MGAAENAIQNSIIEYLRLKGLKAYRLNNAPIFDARRGTFRAAHKYAARGISDIFCYGESGLPKGTFGFIEVKTISGGVSGQQKEFLCGIASGGGTAILARSLTEVMDVMAKQVEPDPETGVFIPSGKWRLRK